MQQVTFTLRTLTPLFLAGADQTQAELRAPTFRGLMRYWYRALVGGLVGTDSAGLIAVKELETSIFGATNTGSKVTIRVLEEPFESISFRRSGDGKDYLLWSMEQFTGKPRRRYIPQDTNFQLILSAKNENTRELEQALAAFWLLIHLGGVGSRSRRCAGSLAVEFVEGDTYKLQFGEQSSKENLQRYLQQGLRTIRKLPSVEPIVVKNAFFDALAQNTCLIWVLHNDGKSWSSSDEAMNAVGTNLQQYRQKKSLQEKSIFGLPLKNVSGKRRASPLLLRVSKLHGEQYVVIAVLFKTVGEGVYSEKYKIIEDWIKQFSGKLEVTF